MILKDVWGTQPRT